MATPITRQKKIFVTVILATIIIVSVAITVYAGFPNPSASASPTHSPTQPVVNLPRPERSCASSVEWHGLRPGISTQQDVIRILGEPAIKGLRDRGENSFPFYSYRVDGGTVANYVTDKIFFRADGVVDWIEAVVGDRDGSYHSVAETIAQTGTVLDTAYPNSNSSPNHEGDKGQIDVMAGPDQLYVWSECGLVLDVLPTQSAPTTLTVRNPNPYIDPGKWSPTPKSIVLMEILFIPTSYQGFQDYYRYKIPYLYTVSDTWGSYMDQVNSLNK